MLAGLELGPGDEIVTADEEHPGLQGPLVAARERAASTIRAVPLADVADAVGPATKLVACSHVSWLSGALAPVAALAEIAARRPGAARRRAGRRGGRGRRRRARRHLLRGLGPEVAVRPGRQRDAVGRAGLAAARRVATAPAYMNLEEPAAGLEPPLAADARALRRRLPGPSIIAGALCRVRRARRGRLAGGARARRRRWPRCSPTGWPRPASTSSPRGDTTLVAWAVADDDEAVALRDRLAGQGVVVRDLPGAAGCARRSARGTTRTTCERLLAALA